MHAHTGAAVSCVVKIVAPSSGEPICDWSADRWVPSKENETLIDLLKDKGAKIVPAGTPEIHFEHTIAAGAGLQFRELLKRQAIATWRDPGTTIGLLYAALYPAFLVGLMFINLTGDDDENGANYTSTALYVSRPEAFVHVWCVLCCCVSLMCDNVLCL
jgi:hypothetical protein